MPWVSWASLTSVISGDRILAPLINPVTGHIYPECLLIAKLHSRCLGRAREQNRSLNQGDRL